MAFIDSPSLRSESQVVFPVVIGISRLFNPSLLAELAQNLGTGAGSFPEYCGQFNGCYARSLTYKMNDLRFCLIENGGSVIVDHRVVFMHQAV